MIDNQGARPYFFARDAEEGKTMTKIANFTAALFIAAALMFGVTAISAAQSIAPAPAHLYTSLQDDVTASPANRLLAQDAADVRLISDNVPGAVVVPWGQWAATLIGGFATVIGGIVSAFALKFFAKFVDASTAQRLRDYTQSAVSYAINLVDGAVQGQTLSVPVANQVVERALEYSVDLFGGLINQYGGTDAQRQRIISALNVNGVIAAPARTMTPPAPSPIIPMPAPKPTPGAA